MQSSRGGGCRIIDRLGFLQDRCGDPPTSERLSDGPGYPGRLAFDEDPPSAPASSTSADARRLDADHPQDLTGAARPVNRPLAEVKNQVRLPVLCPRCFQALERILPLESSVGDPARPELLAHPAHRARRRRFKGGASRAARGPIADSPIARKPFWHGGPESALPWRDPQERLRAALRTSSGNPASVPSRTRQSAPSCGRASASLESGRRPMREFCRPTTEPGRPSQTLEASTSAPGKRCAAAAAGLVPRRFATRDELPRTLLTESGRALGSPRTTARYLDEHKGKLPSSRF